MTYIRGADTKQNMVAGCRFYFVCFSSSVLEMDIQFSPLLIFWGPPREWGPKLELIELRRKSGPAPRPTAIISPGPRRKDVNLGDINRGAQLPGCPWHPGINHSYARRCVAALWPGQPSLNRTHAPFSPCTNLIQLQASLSTENQEDRRWNCKKLCKCASDFSKPRKGLLIQQP